MKCDVCRKKLDREEIYALYPEDSSCICRKCFGHNGYNNKINKSSNHKK